MSFLPGRTQSTIFGIQETHGLCPASETSSEDPEVYIHLASWANGFAKTTYNFYLEVISMIMAAGEFPSDAPKAELMEEALRGVRTGKITPKIIKYWWGSEPAGEITRKTIRDEMVKAVLEGLNWELIDKQQFGRKSLSSSGIGDKETEVRPLIPA